MPALSGDKEHATLVIERYGLTSETLLEAVNEQAVTF